MSVKLKPCPFCGSQNIEIANKGIREKGQKWLFYCTNCFAQGPAARQKKNASVRWNFRGFDDD